jgi:small-conductance mechanosensitive channel
MFAVGDEIVTEAGKGRVREITGRTVVIVTPDGEEMHLPNKVVIADPIVNLTDLGSRRSTVDIHIVYGSDLDRAKGIIENAAAACSVTRADPPPEALVAEFQASGIEFGLMFWHDAHILEGLRAVDVVSRSVARALEEHGIEFAFPQRTLWWGQGGEPPESPGGRLEA